jgi:uncharacterized protein YchJ
MNTSTGEVKPFSEVEKLPKKERAKFIPVIRDLSSKQETLKRQIGMYSPCACGSGKKFKFCHYKSPNRFASRLP